MRLTGSRAFAKAAPAPTMPPVLVELMEGLAKDVLKHNPENVYEFCADHMQKLLEIRDSSRPNKELSLEQKIAKAQEKLRQRIRDRQKEVKNILEHSSETQECHNVVETPMQNLDSMKPVVHGDELVMANEVEIFHEPGVALTTKEKNTEEDAQVEDEVRENDTETKELVQKELTENVTGNTSSDDIKPISEIEIGVDETKCEVKDVESTEKNESKAWIENNANEHNESTCVHAAEICEVKAITAMKNDFKEDTTVTEESKESTENVNGVLKENTTTKNSEQIDDMKATAKKGNVPEINQELTSQDDAVKHGEILSQEGNEQIQLAESDAAVSKTENDAEAKDLTSHQAQIKEEVMKHELDDVILIHPSSNNSEIELPYINDNNRTLIKEEVKEEKMISQEIFLDTKHDDILIENGVTTFNPEEPATQTTHSDEAKNCGQNPDSLLPTLDNAAAEEVSHDLPLLHPSEIQLDESQNISTNTEAPDTKSNLEVSVNGSKSEDQVITVKIAEKASAKIDDDCNKHEEYSYTYDIHKDVINCMSDVGKQLIVPDHKLTEQERAYSGDIEVKENNVIRDDTNNKNSNLFESDKSFENIAVSGMDLETAAITIQKVFRTFLFSKSRASTLDDNVNENSLDEDIEKKNFQDEPEYVLTSATLNKERRTLGISRMDTVLQTVNEEKSLSLSDDSSLSSAATTIQAHVRGFLVRNRLASNKTASSSSLVNSDGPSTVSLDDGNETKKTILNIHIVPERGQFMSRDESLLTSIDLPLDNSPPSSINLHPLGYDKSERRKQLKREDAVQSISPPSNSSGKLSEEVDSVKGTFNDSVDIKQESESIAKNDHDNDTNNKKLETITISEVDHDVNTVKRENENIFVNGLDKTHDADTESCDTTLTISSTAETVVDAETYNTREVLSSPEHNLEADNNIHEVVTNSSSDEMDVVTPFTTIPDKAADTENDDKPKLVHSGEFHDIVVQTQVKRTESSVVREFKNVLVYFLLWDKT